MAEYEVIQEIRNLCRNNQMRDIFFEEVDCDDPAAYVRGQFPGRSVELSLEPGTEGKVTVHAQVDGIMHRFVFTPIF